MEKQPQICCICLKLDPNLRKLAETDPNNLPLVTKLHSCVPEIDWKDSYSICLVCNTDLDLLYEFREKCLNSETTRQNLPPYKMEVEAPKPEDLVATTLGDETFKPERAKDSKRCEFKCEICSEVFTSSTKLVRHAVKEHNSDPKSVKPFFCHLCPKKFSCSAYLKQHLIYHDDERTHICTFCGKGYKTKNDLAVHEKLHLNKKEYECEHCFKRFNTHKDLRSHKFVVHTDPSLWPHQCEFCAKKFPIKSNFEAHLRRHKNERPFACHICDKKFSDKVVLKKHFLSHSNKRAHVCDLCHKEYKDKRIMNIHKKKIHGVGDAKIPERVKKFLCHLCPKSYFEKNKLTRHLCSHTGERPFFCTVCPKKFADKSYVKQHMKKAHDVDVTDEA